MPYENLEWDDIKKSHLTELEFYLLKRIALAPRQWCAYSLSKIMDCETSTAQKWCKSLTQRGLLSFEIIQSSTGVLKKNFSCTEKGEALLKWYSEAPQ